MEKPNEIMAAFLDYLKKQEKSRNTVEKYHRDVRHFLCFLGERPLEREAVLEYKETLLREYQPSSINIFN